MNKKYLAIIFFIFATILGFSSVIISAIDRNADEINKEIATAISNGDAKELANYFNSTIDITVPSTEGTFSKVQAELIIKEFFSKYPPKSFQINHEGTSKDSSLFAVGTYVSTKDTFRSYFLIKKTGNIYLMHQLQFEIQ